MHLSCKCKTQPKCVCSSQSVRGGCCLVSSFTAAAFARRCQRNGNSNLHHFSGKPRGEVASHRLKLSMARLPANVGVVTSACPNHFPLSTRHTKPAPLSSWPAYHTDSQRYSLHTPGWVFSHGTAYVAAARGACLPRQDTFSWASRLGFKARLPRRAPTPHHVRPWVPV